MKKYCSWKTVRPKSEKKRHYFNKKSSLCFLSILISFSFSGCGSGSLFYEIYHQAHNEISREMDYVKGLEQNTIADVLMDAMADTDPLFPPLLKITYAEGLAPLSTTDASVISTYIRETSAFISKGILTEISHNYTKLPKKARSINTFTLWKHYDDRQDESGQPYACCFTLYEYKNRYYIKAEFNDARIEDSPYYLPLNDTDSSYLLALSAGDFDYLPGIDKADMDTENDTLESNSIKESLSDIDYEGVAQVSKHQKIEIRSVENNVVLYSSEDLNDIVTLLQEERAEDWMRLDNLPADAKEKYEIIRYASRKKSLDAELEKQYSNSIYTNADGCYLYQSSIWFQVPMSFLEYIESLTKNEQ